jgi:hypothetical protein
MKKVINKIDIKFLLITTLCFTIGYLTMSGDVQRVIPFHKPLNEMAFAFAFMWFGMMSLVGIKK